MPKVLGKLLIPDAGSVAQSILLSGDTNLFRYAADHLATDDLLGASQSQTEPTKRMGLKVGYNASWALYLQSTVDGNGDAFIGHNAYKLYGDAGARWNAAHASFGSRGIQFGYSAGIRFFADNLAATADAVFTPTERARITNDGTLLIGTVTDVAGLIGLPAGSTPANCGILWGTDTNLYRLAADILKTDDSLEVAGSLKSRGAETGSRAFAMAVS